ncbi:MAG: relaxase/mobilization nuclease domain-containing protein [Leptolyngbyaceae cyanobacterium SM1_3_5]|nr:relaxase/mobilization nuclease domain-containing protein [Leptolyngbyaceae cyanobacterium SM1_3_5]
MIAKTLLNRSFEATLRYVLGKEDAKLIYTNEATAVRGDALQVAKAMAAIAQGRNKPCYHIALSPAQGDQLAGMDWFNLSRDFLKGMGVDNHQAIAVLHTDADFQDGQERPHLHFVINRFDSPSINAHPVCLYFPKIERVVRKLEQDYGLEAIPCSWEVDRRGDAPRQYHQSHKQHQPSARQQLQTFLDQAIEQSANLDEFRSALQPMNISLRESKRGWSFELEGRHFAGYQLGKAYTRDRVEQTITTAKPQPQPETTPDQPMAVELRQLANQTQPIQTSAPVTRAPEAAPAPPESRAASAPATPNPAPIDFDSHAAARSMLQHFRQRLKNQKRKELTFADDRYLVKLDAKSHILTITDNSSGGNGKIIAQDEKTPEGWKVAINQVKPEDEQNFDCDQANREQQQRQKPKQRQPEL